MVSLVSSWRFGDSNLACADTYLEMDNYSIAYPLRISLQISSFVPFSMPTLDIPTSTSGWTLVGTAPDDGSDALVWNDHLELPMLGPTEALVKLHAWVLNYPDILSKQTRSAIIIQTSC